MKSTATVAIILLSSACASAATEDIRLPFAQPFLNHDNPKTPCVDGSGTAEPIHGKYMIHWSHKILAGSHEHVLEKNDKLEIGPSDNADYVCVKVDKTGATPDFTLRLRVAAKNPQGKIDEIAHQYKEPASGDRYDYRMYVFPEAGGKSNATGSFFFDDVGSGDSGGTWGGGK